MLIRLQLLVWNIVRGWVVGDFWNAPWYSEEAEDGEEDGCVSTSLSEGPDALLARAAREAACVVHASQVCNVPEAEKPSPEGALAELARRHPVIQLGCGLLSFAAVTSLFALMRCAPMLLRAVGQYPSPCPHRLLSATPDSDFDAMGYAAAWDDPEELRFSATSLLLDGATLAVGWMVLRGEAARCQSPVRILPAVIAGALTAAASLGYAMSMPGGAALAEAVCTVAFAMLLCLWNAVRHATLPHDDDCHDEDEEEEAVSARAAEKARELEEA